MEQIQYIFNHLELFYAIGGALAFIIIVLILRSSKRPKLLPELIPYSMHYKNVRSVLSDEDWKEVARISYKNSNHRCDICGARGRMECHEIWDFNDKKLVQKLVGLTTLCHECHQVKHIGLARKLGWFGDALEHMSKINGISINKCKKYIEYAEMEVKKRREEYDLDLTFLNSYKNILPRKYTKRENDNCRQIKGNW